VIYSLAVFKFQPSSAILVISDYKNWLSNSLKHRLLVLLGRLVGQWCSCGYRCFTRLRFLWHYPVTFRATIL